MVSPMMMDDELAEGGAVLGDARTTDRMSVRNQRVEVITRGERRRRWSVEQKREIASESLLGSKVVRIIPGSAGSPPVADDAILAAAPALDLTDGLAQATVKLNKVLAQADATLAEFRQQAGL